jgi:hypothetical protein
VVRSDAIDDIGAGRFGKAFDAVGPSHLFLLLLVLALLAHFVVIKISRGLRHDDQKEAIGHLLEVAARALVFPESWEAVEVRAYCYRLKKGTRKLTFVAGRSSHRYDDVWADIPMDALDEEGRHVFVIAEAAEKGATVFRELPETRTDAEKEANVWPKIKYVLATAIHPSEDSGPRGSCLGTISFDTSEAGRALLVDNQERTTDIIGCAAEGVAALWS